MWPLRRGLVIEPDFSAVGQSARAAVTSASTSPSPVPDTPPSLLLLERALDEPQAIDARALGAAGTSGLTILLSDAPRSRLLAHDPARRRHVLLEVQPPPPPPAAPPTPVKRPEPPNTPYTPPPPPMSAGAEVVLAAAESGFASAPEPPPPPRLVPIWEQASSAAAATPASCYFITPPRGLAPPLLFLLQPSEGHLYCYPLPARHLLWRRWRSPPATSGTPMASIPAVTAQPVSTSLSSLVVASILVRAPTGQLELYNCADDGTLRCMHRAAPPAPTPPLGAADAEAGGSTGTGTGRLLPWPPPLRS